MAMGRTADISRAGTVYAALLLLFAGFAFTNVALGEFQYLPVTFFRSQDLPVLAMVMALFLIVRIARMPDTLVAGMDTLFGRMKLLPHWAPVLFIFTLALLGAFGILGSYPLSMDEYWARADGYALVSGRAMAEIPVDLRDYAGAMHPIFARISGDGLYWASTYLPVNALFQGLLGPLASPLFAAGAAALLVQLVRQHLPEAKTAPIICLVLAATSAQWVITGMTSFAMSAHLFFNLAWLALVFRKGAAVQIAAGLVAFLAVGLHQFAFFPVFAGFFILELFLSGRRGAAIGQGVVVLAAVAFWASWNGIAYKLMGSVPPAVGGAANAPLADKVMALLTRNDLTAIGTMGMNLLRFQLWQNPLLLPLFALAVPVAWKLKGFWRGCLLSALATLAFMAVVIPYQGHGWGYRYLHHVLGNVTLLAALGWSRLRMSESRAARASFAAAALIALALIPYRYVQAHDFAQPWQQADRAIAKVDAEVVMVDAPDHLFADDLVRNLPEERPGPVRMARAALTDAQLADLCSRFRVATFGGANAEAAGLPSIGYRGDGNNAQNACAPEGKDQAED